MNEWMKQTNKQMNTKKTEAFLPSNELKKKRRNRQKYHRQTHTNVFTKGITFQKKKKTLKHTHLHWVWKIDEDQKIYKYHPHTYSFIDR